MPTSEEVLSTAAAASYRAFMSTMILSRVVSALRRGAPDLAECVKASMDTPENSLAVHVE